MSNHSVIPPMLRLTRQQRLQQIRQHKQWDIIVIGGGITGAGILKLASQCGLKILLIEQKDFAWGSSSRSSKMVHGGLRYIAQGDMKLARESVQERQRLLNEAPGLVTQQSFALSHFQKQFPSPLLFSGLLSIYDIFAGKKQHQYWQQLSYQFLVPNSTPQKGIKNNAVGGTQFTDAMTDDARLVLRLIQEAQELGGQAINYVKAKRLVYKQGKITAVIAETTDCLPSRINPSQADSFTLNAKVVINATGAWASQLLPENSTFKHNKVSMRPLRGSHLLVPSWRLPVASAISVIHPLDKRPVQIFPWQNVTVIGTTDVQHQQKLSQEPSISQGELNYLLLAVRQQFPSAKITVDDIISTFSGVRPVVSRSWKTTDKEETKPSQEKRDHSIWQQAGLITIAGGKLTTFRIIAEQVLLETAKQLKNTLPLFEKQIRRQVMQPIFDPVHESKNLSVHANIYQKLLGCYGCLTPVHISQASAEELLPISYSCTLWSELIWALKYEQVCHLDDLLLRRSRIGNVLPNGALGFEKEIKRLCQKHLQWDDNHWTTELLRYQKIWSTHYSLPTSRKSNE